jgi:hypothetical protein
MLCVSRFTPPRLELLLLQMKKAEEAQPTSDAAAIVPLESLSAKQRLKEYKLAAKEIKSKDSAKKKFAIEKFNDERYFLEGDCLVPLIESLAPKKVCSLSAPHP